MPEFKKESKTNINLKVKSNQSLVLSSIDVHLMTSEAIDNLAAQGVSFPICFPRLQAYLPHRYPFMLVDRITACQPDEWITAYKNLTMNEEFFQGHFPSEPIMPGVLMVEAMAQISGILGFISEGITAQDGYIYLFAGIDKVRFKRPVIPGDTLILRSKKILDKQNIYKFSCTAHVGDTLVATAKLTICRQNQTND